jgi:hypothetical protein
LELARVLQNHSFEGQVLGNLANLLHLQDKHEEAAVLLQQALSKVSYLQQPKDYLQLSLTYAEELISTKQFAEAERVLLENLQLFSPDFATSFLPTYQYQLAELYSQWLPPHAPMLCLKYARSALANARAAPDSWLFALVLFQAGLIEARYGKATLALQLADELQIAKARNPFDGRVHWVRGLALAALGNGCLAIAELKSAEAAFLQQNWILDAHLIGIELDYLQQDMISAQQRFNYFFEHHHHQGLRLLEKYFPNLAKVNPVVNESTNNHQPCLRTLGALLVENGLQNIALRGYKRKQLMVILLEARVSGLQGVNPLELGQILYPEENEVKQMAAIRQLVFRLRELLGANTIETTDAGFYCLGQIKSDVEIFLETGHTQLWRGAYLEDFEQIPGVVHEILSQRLRLSIEQLLVSDGQEAARVAQILYQMNPFEQSYLQLCLQALSNLERVASINVLYQKARLQLLEVGDTVPVDWKDFMRGTVFLV